MDSKEAVNNTSTIITLLPDILKFISSLIWPLIILIAIAIFKKDLRFLIRNIKTIKWGDKEAAFQITTPESESISESIKERMIERPEIDNNFSINTGRFLEKYELPKLLKSYGMLGNLEKLIELILIFQTSRQHTWLVITNRYIYCLLDDAETRISQNIIQWKMDIAEASPILIHNYKKSTGLIDIGNRRNWLFSKKLFPNNQEFGQFLDSIIKKAFHITIAST